MSVSEADNVIMFVGTTQTDSLTTDFLSLD